MISHLPLAVWLKHGIAVLMLDGALYSITNNFCGAWYFGTSVSAHFYTTRLLAALKDIEVGST